MDDTGHRGPPEPLDQSPSPPAAPHADKPYRERRRLDQLRSAIHDRLGPGLANLQLRLELLEEATGGTGAIGEQIAHLRSEATDLVRELARIVHDEPPEVVEREGLLKAVDAACRSAERPGLRVGFHVSGRPRETGRHVAELLYRAVLEGTANVARHAAANRCLVRLAFSASHVTLQVSDNGHGAIQERALPGGSGLGLASLQQAARRLHGEAYLQSRAGAGARLVVKLPLPDGPRPLASGGRKKRGRG